MKKHSIRRIALGYVLALLAIAGIAYANPNTPQANVGIRWFTATDPTSGTGVAAPLWQFLVRTDNNSLYFKSGSANTAWTLISGGGGGGGTVTSITCTANAGLLCTPNPITGTGTLGLAQLITIPNETILTAGGTLNNWDPWSAGPHTTRVEIDPNTATTTITGIVAGNDGDLLWLWNGGNGGTNPNWVTLVSQSGSSSALNRFWIADGKLVNIPNNDGVLLIYDGAFGWTCFQCATSILRAQELSMEPVAIAPALASASSTNNYDPWTSAGVTMSSYVRQDVSGSGTATITGLIAAGAPNSEGRLVVWNNISAAGSTAFLNASGSSAGPNEILTPGGGTFTIGPGGSVIFIYDTTVEMWRLVAPAPSGSSGITGTMTPTVIPMAATSSSVTDSPCSVASGVLNCGPTSFVGNELLDGDLLLTFPSGLDTFIAANNIFSSTQQNINIDASGPGGVVRINSTAGGVTGAGTGGLQVSAGANSGIALSFAPHIVSTGASATLSCNAGTATCAGAKCDDVAGEISIGTGATSCTVTFASTYTTGPSCVVSAGSATTSPIYITTRNALAITITTSGTLPGLIDYQCTGHS